MITSLTSGLTLMMPTAIATTNSPLLGQSLAALTEWVQTHGQPAYRGKQLHQWIYERYARSLADITVFPKHWRAELEHFPVGRSETHYRSVAPDETVKFLLKLADGQIIETVGMPTEKRLTVCVSSQVGCTLTCTFCHTGTQKLVRNLTAAEIVNQVMVARDALEEWPTAEKPLNLGGPSADQYRLHGHGRAALQSRR
ncbi:MAG: hypothetical protein HC857_06835, partial [Synechococcales cyanobacterium RU_4_20]|nr:hypothetical protein [Synechococcales cyanobacterium RU_4_20]